MDKTWILELIRDRDCKTEAERDAMDDAIYAYQRQERAEHARGEVKNGNTWWYVCSNCKTPIDPKDIYCRECGRKFWNG